MPLTASIPCRFSAMTGRRIFAALTLLSLLAACLPGQTPPHSAKGATSPIAGPAVTTTTLPAPGTAAPKPVPQPEPPEPTVPPVPADPVAQKCQSSGGQWANVGRAGLHACVRPTRDAGKQCRAKTDCQGECLARSGSCSPIAPLFGCNDILTEGGLRVTQCVD
jgi:hypothetical protein